MSTTGFLPLVGVFAGPTATVLNTPVLGGGLRPQRLVSDVSVVVEGLSAHPLLGEAGGVSGPREVVLRVGDGLFWLPLPAGEAVEGAQTFFPDGARLYEEVDRFGLGGAGDAGLLSGLARFEFFRAGPPGGRVSGGERLGVDFFPYGFEESRRAEPTGATLAQITNTVQAVMDDDRFLGVQWLEGSPVIEETLYWLSLLIDTRRPIVGQVAVELHQALGSDGGRNVYDGLRYLTSRCWADPGVDGLTDRVGPVVVVDSLVITARDVVKVASRPGGFSTIGTGRGVVGTVDHGRDPVVSFLPTRRHTASSALNLHRLPVSTVGVTGTPRSIETVNVDVLDGDGALLASAVPHVEIVKYGRYGVCGDCDDPAVAVSSLVEHNLANHPLAGLVCEGLVGVGSHEVAVERQLAAAAYTGMPVVRTARGTADNDIGHLPAPFISARDLPATKARMLLMAALLKHGALPPAKDPHHPTPEEKAATATAITNYQHTFNTH